MEIVASKEDIEKARNRKDAGDNSTDEQQQAPDEQAIENQRGDHEDNSRYQQKEGQHQLESAFDQFTQIEIEYIEYLVHIENTVVISKKS